MGIGLSSYGNLMNQVALQNLDQDATCIVFDKDKGSQGEIGLASKNVSVAGLTDDEIRQNILVRSQLMNSIAADRSLSLEVMAKIEQMLFGPLGNNGQYSPDVAGKPLTARVVGTVMSLVDGGASKVGKGVIDLLRNDRTMDEDIEGRLQEVVSALVDAEVEGAAELRESVTAIGRFYSNFLKATGADMLDNADLEQQAAAYLDMAESLREIANSHAIDAEARTAVYSLCEKLSLRGTRLTQIRDDLALNRNDSALMGKTMKSLLTSGIAKGPKGDAVIKAVFESAQKFADITRNVNSFLEKSLDEPNRMELELANIAGSAEELGKIRDEIARAFGKTQPSKLSQAGKYLSLLSELKTRLEAVGNAILNGGDTRELLKAFAPGTMLRGLLSGKLDIDAYLQARHFGIEHGMIDTMYSDANLRDRNSDKLGAGHENTVYKGKFVDKTTGNEGTLALKDRDNANREVYGEVRLGFLSGKKQDSLKANFYCNQAAAALGAKGRVPVVHGMVRQEGMREIGGNPTNKVKIGMNVVRGQALGDPKDQIEADRRIHERLTCEIIESGKTGTTRKSLDGIRGKERNNIRGDLMGQMNELDWVDMLSGEQGRHERNFMFDITNKGARVYGIDNDKSFLKGCVGNGKYRISVRDVWDNLGSAFGTKKPPFVGNPSDLIRFGLGCEFAEGEDPMGMSNDVILSRILKVLDPEHFGNEKSVLVNDQRMVSIDFSRLKAKNSTFFSIFRFLTHVSSMRRPSFITRSMLDKLLAMEAEDSEKRAEYLNSLEGIGEDELESAKLRLDDTIAHAKRLLEKGRVVEDVDAGEGEMLFRRVNVQRQVDRWHLEDRISYIEDTLSELKTLHDQLVPIYEARIREARERGDYNSSTVRMMTRNRDWLKKLVGKPGGVIDTFNAKRDAYKAAIDNEGPGSNAVREFKKYCNNLRKDVDMLFGDDAMLSSFDSFFNGFELDENVQ